MNRHATPTPRPRRWWPLLSLAGLLFVLGVFQPRLATTATPQPQTAQAQDDSAACDGLVTQALELVADTCNAIGTNQICYGYDTISATLTDDSMFFDRPGDIIPVTALASLNTASIDPNTGDWGIALMDVQADIPVADGSVRILLFGGAQLQPEASTAALPTCTFNNGDSTADLRATPELNARVTDVLPANAALSVYGTTANGDWLRSARGWVASGAGTLDCSADSLTTMDTNAAAFVAPMQSMSLRVDESALCESVPTGMLIQTPSGQTASLAVNGVEMQVGSTALLELDDSAGCQTVYSFSGDVDVVSYNTPLPVGGAVRVPTGDAGRDCFRNGTTYRPVVETIGAAASSFVPRLTAQLEDTALLDAVDTPDWQAGPPDVFLTADGSPAAQIIRSGECVLLEWSATNAATVALNGQNVALQGVREVCPESSSNYVVTAVALSDVHPDMQMLLPIIVRSDGAALTDSEFDFDDDGVADLDDNCPDFFNPAQRDDDGNFIGDACQTTSGLDFDGDGISDLFDICPNTPNPDQRPDDACLQDEFGGEPDDFDGDSVRDIDDNCFDVANPAQLDRDRDGVGNACEHLYAEFDSDGDRIDDVHDNCPFTYNPGQRDADGDGIGDRCFGDDAFDFDGDGVDDLADNCPELPNPGQRDTDDDGVGDACADIFIADTDGDGVNDLNDNCPFDFNPNQRDEDGNSFGDSCDEGDFGLIDDDLDGDGWLDFEDRCPEDPGFNNGCPADDLGGYDDRDGDGWFDHEDDCPALAGDDFGCPAEGVDFERDADDDGWFDFEDDCPNTPGDLFGCPQDDLGRAENDTDGDGWFNFEDECPAEFGLFRGCPGDPTADGDGDGFTDDEDFCPFEPGDDNGCPEGGFGDPERDRDGDGWLDIDDDCPDVPGEDRFFGCPDDGGFDAPPPADDNGHDDGDMGDFSDRDGDGWLDIDDDCPDVPGEDRFFGCPDDGGFDAPPPADDNGHDDDGDMGDFSDRDGDGWLDIDDDCPDQPGIDDFFGCPDDGDFDAPPPADDNGHDDGDMGDFNDRDGDGWLDIDDDCPDQPGIDDFFGCPDDGDFDAPPPE